MPELSAENVTAGYGDLTILRGTSVRVEAGEVVGIIGPNGAGKSTLLKAIFGLLPVREGSIRLRGEEIAGLAPNRIVERGMAYVPQLSNVFPNLTVRENLEMGAFIRHRDPEGIRASLARVHALFPILDERAQQCVGKMSGGERQMVAMGRALMSDPKVLLLDEPSAGLAPNVQDLVFENVRAIARSGIPVLLVEQNAKKALRISDRAYVLEQGKNKYEGRGADLLADPNVGKLYLGG